MKEPQRAMLWAIFARVRAALTKRSISTYSEAFSRVASKLQGGTNPPFDFVVVDEAQDVSVAQLRFPFALGGKRANGLFFSGDMGQRIFQQPFSWKGLR
jgi:superfamily I DNA/RNA helicase